MRPTKRNEANTIGRHGFYPAKYTGCIRGKESRAGGLSTDHLVIIGGSTAFLYLPRMHFVSCELRRCELFVVFECHAVRGGKLHDCEDDAFGRVKHEQAGVDQRPFKAE